MDAKSLMIGDWVLSPMNHIYRIAELTKDFCNLDNSQGSMADIMPTIGVKYDYLRPIPLTAEILEKNGFAADGFRAYVKDDVTVYPATNKDHFTDIDHPVLSVWKAGHVRELNIRCDYVHTLQHALRLCGLTELADNIKIE